MLCTLTHRLADSPATLALFTLSFFRFDFKLTAVINNFNFGNYECCTKLRLSLFKKFKCFAACTKCYLCFKRTLNCLILIRDSSDFLTLSRSSWILSQKAINLSSTSIAMFSGISLKITCSAFSFEE